MDADSVIRQAARYIAIDPAMASDLMEVSISQHHDELHLRNIQKMARTRIYELRRARPRRQPRWTSYGFRHLMQMTGNAAITFYRDVTRSTPEKNGIYQLTIGPPAPGNYYPVVTLLQPDGSRVEHGRTAPANATAVPYGRQTVSGNKPVIYLDRLAKMMQASMIGSKEAVASFFNLGVSSDWTQERAQDHLAYRQAWIPSQKVSAYDDGFLRKLPLFANLRKTFPASMSDRDVLGTVREALVREQEAFGAAEAARAEARRQTLATAPVESLASSETSSDADDDDFVEDEGDYED